MTIYPTADARKAAAAARALQDVADGMTLGLGTGSTAAHFVRALGSRVREGLKVRCAATSEETAALALSLGIPIFELDALGTLDLTVDGADEIDPDLSLIKGGGGALLREKIVAAASRAVIIIADDKKAVETLGAFPLPVEIVPFAHRTTMQRIAEAAAMAGCAQNLVTLRGGDAHPFVTDGGHYIADCDCGRIPDPETLAAMLASIPGIVDHGLFIGLASKAYIAGEGGVTEQGQG